jgi:hypothetical protein
METTQKLYFKLVGLPDSMCYIRTNKKMDKVLDTFNYISM